MERYHVDFRYFKTFTRNLLGKYNVEHEFTVTDFDNYLNGNPLI